MFHLIVICYYNDELRLIETAALIILSKVVYEITNISKETIFLKTLNMVHWSIL